MASGLVWDGEGNDMTMETLSEAVEDTSDFEDVWTGEERADDDKTWPPVTIETKGDIRRVEFPMHHWSSPDTGPYLGW